MTIHDLQRYGANFTEASFVQKIIKCGKKIGVKTLYVAMLLFCALKSPAVSRKDKSIIIGALGYLILPVDMIPDFLPLGFTDDFTALMFALKTIYTAITPEIEAEAKAKLASYVGDVTPEDLNLF